MLTVTVEQMMAMEPCGHDGDDDGVNYCRARVERLWGVARDAL